MNAQRSAIAQSNKTAVKHAAFHSDENGISFDLITLLMITQHSE
jgi:hypothetical protein